MTSIRGKGMKILTAVDKGVQNSEFYRRSLLEFKKTNRRSEFLSNYFDVIVLTDNIWSFTN